MPKGVSFLMPTFGRFPQKGDLLNEAVYWFTKTEYPKSKLELVILNDDPAQELQCNIDNVTVVNFPTKFKTLGDKRNFLISIANYDVCIPWDDDDISLPYRAVVSEEMLFRRKVKYWDPGARWYQENNILHHTHKQNCTHHASAYLKSIGYLYPSQNTGEDQKFLTNVIQQKIPYLKDNITDIREWQYIYRWGVSNFHVSTKTDAEIEDRKSTSGTFIIEPIMKRDYVKETLEICKKVYPPQQKLLVT